MTNQDKVLHFVSGKIKENKNKMTSRGYVRQSTDAKGRIWSKGSHVAIDKKCAEYVPFLWRGIEVVERTCLCAKISLLWIPLPFNFAFLCSKIDLLCCFLQSTVDKIQEHLLWTLSHHTQPVQFQSTSTPLCQTRSPAIPGDGVHWLVLHNNAHVQAGIFMACTEKGLHENYTLLHASPHSMA